VEVAEETVGMGDEEKREKEAKSPRNAHAAGGDAAFCSTRCSDSWIMYSAQAFSILQM
jgi:hypothetical protein